MGFLQRWFGKRQEKRGWLTGPAPLSSADAIASPTYGMSEAGVTVNEHTAVQASAFMACLRVIAETLACLPCEVHQSRGGRSMLVPDHRNNNLINVQPSDLMTGYTFKETLTSHAFIHGDGFAYLPKTAAKVTDLLILNPERTEAKLEKGQLIYRTVIQDKPETLTPDEVFHIHGLGFNGLRGFSPIQLAARQIGHALALDKSTAKWFGNSPIASGILKTDGVLEPQAQTNLRQSIERVHGGVENFFKLLLLEQGIDYEPFPMIPPEQLQFLETKKYSALEIARICRVQPHMIGILEQAWATIEQQAIDFVKYSLRPWLERWETEANRKLFTEAERAAGFYVRFNVDDLQRGDKLSRYNTYNVGRMGGWLNINDIRQAEHLNPIEAGEDYLQPLNMELVRGDEAFVPSRTLQGPQITAVTNIVTMVANGSLPRDAGIGQLVELMNMTPDRAEAIMGSAGAGFKPKEPAKPETKEPAPDPAQKPDDGPDPADLAQDIQTDPALVLNGAQVTAALQIVNQVSEGMLPKDTAMGMLKVFFNLSDEQATEIMGSLEPKPQTAPAVGPTPPEPDPDQKPDMSGLVKDAARRVLTKEINAVRRAAKKHLPHDAEGFRAWADEFYSDHDRIVRQSFAPVLEAMGRDDVDKYVMEHRAASMTKLSEAETLEQITALMEAWQNERLNEILVMVYANQDGDQTTLKMENNGT